MSGHVVLYDKVKIDRLRIYLKENNIKYETSGYYNGVYFALWDMTKEQFDAVNAFLEVM